MTTALALVDTDTDVAPVIKARKLDDNDRAVMRFGLAVHQADSINKVTDAIIAIAQSNAWREYTLQGKTASWLESEFDYFLIACGIRYTTMVDVLKWRADAQLIAPTMDQRSENRRPIRVASDDWNSPIEGKTLVSIAKELGWVTERGKTRTSPVGRRARARANGGMSREEAARLSREARIGATRMAVLDQLATQLRKELNRDERRYLADALIG